MTTHRARSAAEAYGADHLQRRTFTTRATAVEGKREVLGTAVPWDTEVEIWPGFRESWAPGAAVMPEDGTKLFWRHTDPIGRLVKAEDGKAGWDVVGRVSRTQLGDEALTLAEDEVVTQMSVGFRATDWEEHKDEDGTLHVRITRAEVPEVSLVPFGAYGNGANVTGTREHHPHHPSTTHREDTTAMGDENTTTITAEDFAGLRTDVAELRQTVATLPDTIGGQRSSHPGLAFRSIGEYAQALAAGDERAVDLFTRADELATTDDTWTDKGTNWMGNTVRLIQERQRILRLFTHLYNLPAKGMRVEHGTLLENTIDVDEQINQGDTLVFGKLRLGEESAPVKTFGGYTKIARQTIERGSTEYLDFVFQAFAIAYGKAMEAYARAVLTAAYAAQVDAEATVAAPAALGSMTDLDWLSVILDADEALDDAGHTLAGLLVGKDVLLSMAAIEAKDRMLRWAPSGPGDKAAGTLHVRRGGPRGDVLGIQVDVNPAWKGQGRAMAYDPFALVTREAPGAPFRLSDQNVTNLTNDFSVYGYGTSYVQAQNALVPITFGTAG